MVFVRGWTMRIKVLECWRVSRGSCNPSIVSLPLPEVGIQLRCATNCGDILEF
jgi:hypothetical protein